MKQKIGLLFGGRSGEYEVSLKSAYAIAKNFDKSAFDVIPIVIDKKGHWLGPVEIEDIKNLDLEKYQYREVALLPKPGGYLIDLTNCEILVQLDSIFSIIHGTYGEDGTLQGLFELADVPYIGAGVAGSAIGMDKILMRKILAYHNIPQVEFLEVSRIDIVTDIDATIHKITSTLAYPLFVKPANAGSSVGISKACDEQSLLIGLECAAKYDKKILIEQGIDVHEIEIAVLGNDKPKASIIGEIIPCNEFYDYNAKYIDNRSVAQIPAHISEELTESIKKMAIQVYQYLDCRGLARVDFFIEKKTKMVYLNEINTLPGFTEISMYPKLWAYDGFSMQQLLCQLVQFAKESYEERKKNIIDF